MGVLDLSVREKQVEEITRALVGVHVFSKLKEDQREVVMNHVYRLICESEHRRITFDEAKEWLNGSHHRVQAAFMVNAMIDLGIPHGLSGYRWDYIPDPFALKHYPNEAVHTARSKAKEYGVDAGASMNGN